MDRQGDGRTDTRSQRPLILPLRKTCRNTFDLPPPHNGKVRVHKFFSHRSTYLSPICSEMISHCNLELSRLLTRSFRKQFSCPSPRATTIYAFLDSKEFEEIERAAKHLNSSKSDARARRGRQIRRRSPSIFLLHSLPSSAGRTRVLLARYRQPRPQRLVVRRPGSANADAKYRFGGCPAT